VWAPRAQADRTLYKRAVRFLLEQFPALELSQGMVTNLLFDRGGTRITGVETGDGRRFTARAVIITAGTFLRGRIHLGTETQIPAGRAGDQPSVEMAQVIANVGLTVSRFTTGTPRCARPRARPDDSPRLRERVRLLSADAAHSLARGEDRRSSLLRRSDQRHDRVRGGGWTGRRGGNQCGAPDPWSRAGRLRPR